MDSPEQQIQHVIADLSAIADPADRARAAGAMLAAVPELQRQVGEIRRVAVKAMNDSGLSYAQIGLALGIDRARAQQIGAGRTSSAAKRRRGAGADAPPAT